MTGINICFDDGTVLYVPTAESRATVVAIVEEFLDTLETDPQGAAYTNLPVKFLSWYAGTQELGIKVGDGPAVSSVIVAKDRQNIFADRPTVS
ncbi:MAG: hypothetical protein DRQ48_00235 [Gammaproteobacteria bacterium]|nr:MAG: hypothetical protein DRQ48_00235 [Gammaproteobacteria bacterium]